MRSFVGVLTFVGVALLVAAARWPEDPWFVRSAPMEAVGFALMLTPFVATWVMPTRWSLLLFPVAAFGLWYASGWIGTLIPMPPLEEQRYMCGLGAFATMMLGMIGLVAGVVGRALGFTVMGKMNALGVYLVQLIPIGGFLALCLMLSSGPRP